MMFKSVRLLLPLLMLSAASAAVGERESFDFGWKFKYYGSGDPAMAGSPVQTDSAQGGTPAMNAFDGNPDTRWCADNFHEGHWLVIKPGLTAPVKEIRFQWEKPNDMMVHAVFMADGKEEARDIMVKGKDTTVFKVGGRHISEMVLEFFNTNQGCWAGAREITFIGMDGKPMTMQKTADPYAPAKPDFNDREELMPGTDKVSKLFRTKTGTAHYKTVQLPHDWAIESPFLMDEPNETGKLPWNGWAWYRKQFTVPDDFSAETQRWYLDFDGVMSHPKVFVNGELAGEWAYGYNSFRVDITPFLKPGKKNLVAVMVSNLPLSTRWYPGAGIYRHVWLVKKEPVQIGEWGVRVTTPEIAADKAVVQVETTIENTGKTPAQVELTQAVGEAKAEPQSLTLAPGESRVVEQKLELKDPKLWSVEKPNLYELKTALTVNGKAADAQKTSFGVRTAEWKKDGFYLNGERVQIKGVCEHHDNGGLGAAFYSRAFERKIQILREMGCNAIRMTHNPPAPEALELCDKYGMLVIDELFDIWKQQKYDKVNGYHVDWPKWWQKDVRNFMLRDRNHPCIIAWSGGNEVPELSSAGGAEVSAQLRDEIRKYDTTRPYTVGCNETRIMDNGFVDTMDIVGFNYRPFYYGTYREKEPEKPVYGSETNSCVSTRDWYKFPLGWKVSDGIYPYQVSSYDTSAPAWGYCADIEFQADDDHRDVAGMFVWTGFDYLGEPTPYNLDQSNEGNVKEMSEEERAAVMAVMASFGNRAPSRSSYFGIIDLAGFPKDLYYQFQSYWRPDLPMAHILPHWNWKGREGKVTPVMVYTTGDEAELFINGKSQGVRRRGEGDTFTQKNVTTTKNSYRFVWEDTVYQPGTVEVVVKKNGKPWAKAKRVTAGAPAAVSAKADRSTIAGDGRDLSYIELAVVDKKGNPVLTDERKVSFKISGPGELIGFCNGNPIDLTCAQDKKQSFFNGRLLAIVRGMRGRSGKVTVHVKPQDLPAVDVELQVSKSAQ